MLACLKYCQSYLLKAEQLRRLEKIYINVAIAHRPLTRWDASGYWKYILVSYTPESISLTTVKQGKMKTYFSVY